MRATRRERTDRRESGEVRTPLSRGPWGARRKPPGRRFPRAPDPVLAKAAAASGDTPSPGCTRGRRPVAATPGRCPLWGRRTPGAPGSTPGRRGWGRERHPAATRATRVTARPRPKFSLLAHPGLRMSPLDPVRQLSRPAGQHAASTPNTLPLGSCPASADLLSTNFFQLSSSVAPHLAFPSLLDRLPTPRQAFLHKPHLPARLPSPTLPTPRRALTHQFCVPHAPPSQPSPPQLTPHSGPRASWTPGTQRRGRQNGSAEGVW